MLPKAIESRRIESVFSCVEHYPNDRLSKLSTLALSVITHIARMCSTTLPDNTYLLSRQEFIVYQDRGLVRNSDTLYRPPSHLHTFTSLSRHRVLPVMANGFSS